MKNIKNLTFIIIFSMCLMVTHIAIADDEIAPTDQVTADSTVIISDSGDSNIQTPTDIETFQETFNVQDGGEVELLDNSEDTDISPPPADDSTNTDDINDEIPPDTTNGDEIITDTQDTVDENTDENTPTDEPVQDPTDESVNENYQDFIVTKPKPVYSFSVSSRSVTTKKKVTRQRVDTESPIQKGKNGKNLPQKMITEVVDESVDSIVTPNVDNETGVISLNGLCSKEYFVVLVYKNEADYAENAGSYILNKAFNCENGNFNYAIDDLPRSLQNGTYYILIGEQGTTGTWTPASALTEINLTRN